MDEGKESVRIAVPFISGIFVAGSILPLFRSRPAWLCAAASLSFTAAAVMLAACIVLNRAYFPRFGQAGGFFRRGPVRGRFMLGALAALAGAAGRFAETAETAAAGGGAGLLTAAAQSCRARLTEAISSIPYSRPEYNALATAFLTGDRTGIPPHIAEIFRTGGASHLLALSGLHMGIICMAVSRLLSTAGNSPAAKTVRSVLTVAGAGFFTMMTGASPSSVRAFLFILLGETAKLSGRKAEGVPLLCSAMMIQLAFSPHTASSLSFQMSYLAMTGLATVYPAMREWNRSGIWRICAGSIACQLFTGPLAWLRFGTFPQYFLLTNLLCIPLMSIAMFCTIAAASAAAAGIYPDIAAKACEIPLAAMTFVLETVSSM